MLSFIKDNEGDEAKKVADQSDNGVVDKEQLSGQEEQQQDYLMPAEYGKSVKQGTIILAVLFSLGAVCLWFMIKKTAPLPASASVSTEEMQIENAIAQLTGIHSQGYDQTDKVINKFYQFSDVKQIAADELKKNPFEHRLGLVDSEQLTPQDSPDLDVNMGRLDGNKIRRKAKELQLWSIMKSEHDNSCMIDDRILYEGDTIKGFKVVGIGSNFVKLMSDGVSIVLKMPE